MSPHFAMLMAAVLLVSCGPSIDHCVLPVDPPSPSPSPSSSPTAGPDPSPSPTPGGGEIVIAIPTPAPIVCSPATVTLTVAQAAIITCSSQGYSGALSVSLSNPAIASVTPAAGTNTFFSISALAPGSTVLSLSSAVGATGTVPIVVTP